MFTTTRSRIAGICLLLAATTVTTATAADGFRAALLSDMATAMNMRQQIEALDEGQHVGTLSYKGHPVTVVVKDNHVVHIGYSVFTAEHRKNAGSPFFDVVERYALLEKLPLKRDKSIERELFEEGIHIDTGSLSMLPSFYAATDIEFSLANEDGKKYRASWQKGGKTICEIELPFTYSLLHGTTMEENENMLVSELLEHSGPITDSSVFIKAEIKRDGLVTYFPYSYYILPGESYYFDSLNANRYYTKADSTTFAPIYDPEYPQESMANVTTSLEVPNSLMLEVKVIQYNYRSTTVTLPLSAFVKYCFDNGCTPFFGIIERNSDKIICQLIMRNENEGYCHLMKLNVDATVAGGTDGKITARLNPYIPISKISDLFADRNGSQPEHARPARKIKFQTK